MYLYVNLHIGCGITDVDGGAVNAMSCVHEQQCSVWCCVLKVTV